jgi:predicted TIM-barrel fold metal-dependent hydrolase
MIADSHVHILPNGIRQHAADIGQREPWFAMCHAKGEPMASAGGLLAAMDRDGIDKAVCFTWPFADAALCTEGNDFLAEAQRQHPDRIIGFGVVQPLDRGATAEVRRCAELGLRGLGELNADAQGWQLSGPEISEVAAAAVDAGFPINLHCSEPEGRDYPGRGTATPDRIVDFAQRHPDLKIIAAHLGGGLPFYWELDSVKEACNNVWLDTSAMPLLYGPDAYRAAVDHCGVKRILFGSDYPLLELPRYRKAFAGAQLAPPELDAVLGNNLAALLNL